MKTVYIIKGHADSEIGPSYNWDESYAGSERVEFATEAEAEAGIVQLRICGDDFADADWRVFAEEIDE